MNFKLPDLHYSYDAFEPFFDAETMKIHYTKHHQAYIDNANTVLTELKEFSELTVINLIKVLNRIPENNKTILRNNAGGHINHSLFWTYLKTGTVLKGSLKNAIEHHFSSIPEFKNLFEKTALSRFGSGWVWLIKQHDNTLRITSTANQDNPLMESNITGGIHGHPILGLDVWEHAYYLKYQNRRTDYVKSFWNIVNWDEVEKQYHSIHEC